MNWGDNKNDLKLVFIAGNEPFTQGKINYVDAVTDAKEKGVIINTIFCGNYTNGISGKWKDGADLGGGDYMTINQDEKIVHIVTPYDHDILILNKKLNDTYIYYGTQGRSKYQSQRKQDANAQSLNETVVVKRAVSKSSRLYNNSSWDLVDAEKKGKVDYSKIKKESLPAPLRAKTDKELKTHVKEQAKKRKEIQFQIKELDKKRRAFIAEKKKKNNKKEDLNNAIIKAIKKQAKAKNYNW